MFVCIEKLDWGRLKISEKGIKLYVGTLENFLKWCFYFLKLKKVVKQNFLFIL